MINRTMGSAEWTSLTLLAAIWGGAFFFIDVAVAEVAPLTFVWLRLSLAAAALWLFLWLRGGAPLIPRTAIGTLLAVALLNNALPFTLFAWAQTRVDGGLASILNATSPIWTVLVAHYFTSDEGITPARLIGVLLGFAGVVAMIGPNLSSLSSAQVLAQLACLGGALCYAMAGVWARRFRTLGVPPASVAAWQLLLSATMVLPLAMLIDRPWTAAMPSVGAWGAIIALALVCSAFAYILYFRLIEKAGATNALLVTLLTPPVAILLSWAFRGERLASWDLVGLVLIAAGLAAIDGRLLRRRRPMAKA